MNLSTFMCVEPIKVDPNKGGVLLPSGSMNRGFGSLRAAHRTTACANRISSVS